MPESLKFIDLFAGLGGFHQALNQLGHECVFACELDEGLRDLYERNYGLKPEPDIRSVVVADVPDHDILCAGFPCQSFSKAGRQQGLTCETNGDLIDYVIKIIEAKSPDFIMLENVPNLAKHDGGRTYASIKERLEAEYDITDAVLSPHHFGIPQVRERLFIVGARHGLDMFTFPERAGTKPDIKKRLDKNPKEAKKIPQYLIDCINVWQEFLDKFPLDDELPSFPIWAMEFGADYPLDGVHPLLRTVKEMRAHKGSFGESLAGCRKHVELERALPHYVSFQKEVDAGEFPEWKVQFIRQNRELYEKNKEWIDAWLPKLRKFPHSLQKLEWNCKGEPRKIWNYVLQIRASGVRVKRPTTAPSLIAMTTTQVPIIAWEKRYMTPKECAKLQSMNETMVLPDTPTRAYKALGNAVNVWLVRTIAARLLSQNTDLSTEPESRLLVTA